MQKLLSSKWVVFCFLTLIVLAVFGRTIWFDYVNLDEGVLIISNHFFISKIGNILEIFKHDVNYPSATAPYYRPILTLSFMLNSQISSSPMSYHVGNILLHVIVSCLIFLLFLELGYKKSISGIFASLFAVHPAVTTVVAWVPGRNDLLLVIFTILSFISFIKFLKTERWLYLGLYFVSFGFGLLTKELIIPLPALLFFYYLIYRKEKLTAPNNQRTSNARIWMWLGGSAAMVMAWFFIRKSIIGKVQLADLSFFEMFSVMWSNILAALLYLGKVLLPFNLTVLPLSENSGLIFGSIALLVLAAYWFWNKIKFFSLNTLGILWFALFLAPSLVSYDQPIRMIFFEHRLYLPMLGIFIFLIEPFRSSTSQWITSRWKLSFLPVAGVFVLFSVLAFNYSGFYKDKIAFWQKAVADSPETPRSHSGLGTVYILDGKIEEAEKEFTKALELNPNEKRLHLLLGLFYLDQNQYDKAQMELEKEVELDPKQFVAYHNLGRIYAQKKNLKKAEELFLETVAINPDYVLVRQDLVVLYFSQNKHPQAVAQLKELLRVQRPEAMHPQITKILETYAKEIAKQQGL